MIRVLGDRVLVALPPRDTSQDDATGYSYQREEVTPSGIILAKPTDAYDLEVATRGLVVQVGQKRRQVDLDAVLDRVQALGHPDDRAQCLRALEALGPAPFEVAVGDCVLFPPGVGEQIDADGVSYVILHEDQILACVDPLEDIAA